MTNDYRDLPEELAASIANLIDATNRAAPIAHYCVNCRHIDTLRVDTAERSILNVIRRLYVPEPKTETT